MSQLLSINEETPLMGSSDGEADADEPVFVDAYMTHEEKLKALLAAIDSSMAALRQVVNDDNLLPPPVHPTRLPKLSPYIVARLLPLTILWQVLNILILTLLDVKIQDISEIRHPTDNNAFLSGVVIMAVFQFLHLILIVASTIKLTKQLLHHTASDGFLLQSYVSTILLYAGIYTLLHRLDMQSWHGITNNGKVKSSTYMLMVYGRFVYYSTATMTGTGFGDISPKSWYLDLIVSTQMLLSVLYTTTIFARGLTAIGGPQLVTRFIPNADTADPRRAHRQRAGTSSF
eukprot:m.86446 g.86446  ORF g.86446 m.86446 type:complete len:288 (+) comp8432_c0_seq5:929-1792(+)